MNPIAGSVKSTHHKHVSNYVITCKRKVLKREANNKCEEEKEEQPCKSRKCKVKAITRDEAAQTHVDKEAVKQLRSASAAQSVQSRLLLQSKRIIVKKKVHPSLPGQCGNGTRPCRCKRHAVPFVMPKNASTISKCQGTIRISNVKTEDTSHNKVASTATSRDSNNQIKFVETLKYEKLMLSLQSPLPNEHQFALEACLILSKMREKSSVRLDVLEKTPALLNMLLAHAGFYNDCALRSLVEQTYREAFGEDGKANGYDFAAFWEQLCCFSARDAGIEEDEMEMDQSYKQKFQLLCECYPGRMAELSETEKGIIYGMDNSVSSVKCCNGCRVKLLGKEGIAADDLPYTQTLSGIQTSKFSVALEKIGTRIELVAEILRNFSFDTRNAVVMMGNRAMLRFLLIAFQINYRSFTQIAADIVSNITKCCVDQGAKTSKNEMEEDPVISQLKNLIANLVCATILSTEDRFKIIRCAEAISGFAMSGDRKSRIVIVSQRLCERLLQLLTLKEDAILVINCLECLLAITAIGEAICDEMVHVQGSLTTLMTYVAMEANMNNEVNIAIKSSRLTTLLILRNVVTYSRIARRSLKRYETQFANLAMSEEDCSWVAAEILYYLAEEDSHYS